jgi:hypothetical protein
VGTVDDLYFLAVGLLSLAAFQLGAVLLERLRKGDA